MPTCMRMQGINTRWRTRVSTIRRKYTIWLMDEKSLPWRFNVTERKPLRAIFGRKPIQRKTSVKTIQDKIVCMYTTRNELITRLLSGTCELCGSTTEVEGHHIRKLKDLKKRWKGRKKKPAWVRRMIALNRKSLFVCKTCHQNIHNGTYDGRKLTQA